MSGLFTPIHSMPEWAQWITRINPLRYFVEVMRTIYLRGGGFAELLPQLGGSACFCRSSQYLGGKKLQKKQLKRRYRLITPMTFFITFTRELINILYQSEHTKLLPRFKAAL